MLDTFAIIFDYYCIFINWAITVFAVVPSWTYMAFSQMTGYIWTCRTGLTYHLDDIVYYFLALKFSNCACKRQIPDLVCCLTMLGFFSFFLNISKEDHIDDLDKAAATFLRRKRSKHMRIRFITPEEPIIQKNATLLTTSKSSELISPLRIRILVQIGAAQSKTNKQSSDRCCLI